MASSDDVHALYKTIAVADLSILFASVDSISCLYVLYPVCKVRSSKVPDGKEGGRGGGGVSKGND